MAEGQEEGLSVPLQSFVIVITGDIPVALSLLCTVFFDDDSKGTNPAWYALGVWWNWE